jgi:putative ABC transport system permease protein
MKETTDIGLWNLLLAFVGMAIPLFVFYYFKLKVIKDMLVGMIRMVVQLFLVAVYLEWIFKLNSAWINSLWVLIMILVGAGTVLQRVKLKWRTFLIPFSLAGLVSMLIIDSFLSEQYCNPIISSMPATLYPLLAWCWEIRSTTTS